MHLVGGISSQSGPVLLALLVFSRELRDFDRRALTGVK
jgi:hypothetical protein